MKRIVLSTKIIFSTALMSLLALGTSAQTNVYNDVIATSPAHTSLDAALQQANLVSALQDSTANLTVFAPDNAAFSDLAAAFNTDINGLLMLPNLSDILLYHVLGSSNTSGSLSNGQIVTPLNNTNTVKLTVGGGSVYANQALVNGADLTADNGVVHSLNAVLLPVETVADIAIDNGFTTLVTAVATAQLLPALTNPEATLTVFAPDNNAFDDAVASLGISMGDLLASPDLSDILLYHVLGAEVEAADVVDGGIVTALSPTNTIKTTVTGSGDVFINQAQVQLTNLNAANGIVHTLNGVILPNETVVDVAIDNSFTSLTAAVIEAELLPTLSNPYTQFTVFAPTDQAFDDLAMSLGVTINDILALPNLADILLYHAFDGKVLSTNLSNGSVSTLEGGTVLVDLTMGVMINDAEVVLANVEADNGVVHAINKVLDPATASITENTIEVSVYPNPAAEFIAISASEAMEFIQIVSMTGEVLKTIDVIEGQIKVDVSELSSGQYILVVGTPQGKSSTTFNVSSRI